VGACGPPFGVDIRILALTLVAGPTLRRLKRLGLTTLVWIACETRIDLSVSAQRVVTV